MAKSSPYFTGQGGADFEFSVCAYYLSFMLTGDIPQCLEREIEEIHLQTSYQNATVDDILITTRFNEEVSSNFFQVKHSLNFDKNDNAFTQFISYAWKQYSDSKFSPKKDKIILGLGLISPVIEEHLIPLCEWARSSSNEQNFMTKVMTRGYASEAKRKCFNLMKEVLTLSKGNAVTDSELWNFLRCFLICRFEVSEGGKDWNYCMNRLSDFVVNCDSMDDTKMMGGLFFSHLYRFAGHLGNKGGSINREQLKSKMSNLLRRGMPIKPSGMIYDDTEKMINNLVYKKLLGLSIVRDTLSSRALKVGNDYYERIPYIKIAERILVNYPKINNALVLLKDLIKEHNNKSTELQDEITDSIQKEMGSRFPNLSKVDRYSLLTQNSYSLPSLVELTYDYCEKGENSEISLFLKVNFYSGFNDNLGWILYRELRGLPVSTADFIITSDVETNTKVEIIFEMLKTVGSDAHLMAVSEEINKLRLNMDAARDSFVALLNELSESIDTNMPPPS